MKKKVLISLGILILVISVVILIIFLNNKDDIIIQNNDFIYLGSYYEDIVEEENYIFKNYDSFLDYFESSDISKDSFKNNNYLLVKIIYDECSEKNVTPTNYKIRNNNIIINVKYTASCGVCAPEYLYYLLKINKNIDDANVKINYEAVNSISCDPNVSYKPLIYLYPTKKMNVKVKLGYEELLTITYPKYYHEWNVTAYPNGNLVSDEGREYYGLYWEGLNYINSEFIDGFVVKGSETTEFLEEKLSILGLNEREINEFIIYWIAKLEENKYNLIRFESIDVINEQMPLKITPTPDTVIRVLMEYKPLDNKVFIKEQKLVSQIRNGFTAVEWGGTLIK